MLHNHCHVARLLPGSPHKCKSAFCELWAGAGLVAVDSLEDDLLLDEVLVLVGADPGRAGTESRRVLLVLMRLLHDVVICVGAHDEEAGCGLLARHFFVCDLVEVVMDHFTEIN